MSTINFLQNKMNLSTQNINLISANLANINTPNYKRQYIDVQNSQASEFDLMLKKNREKHLSAVNSSGEAIHEGDYFIRTDKNGVDIDVEVLEMSKNSMFHNSLIRLLNGSLQTQKNIINSK